MESDTDHTLPPLTQLLHHQVGGHEHGKGRTKLGMLKHIDGNVLKPLPNDSRGEREVSFYQLIMESAKDDVVISELAYFMPKCLGTWSVQFNNLNIEYLRLENIGGSFFQPCNLDIKIGAITYDPEASPQKRKHEQEKYPEGEVIGFRILGMHVYDENLNKYISFNKDFGKSLSAGTVINGKYVDSLSLTFRTLTSEDWKFPFRLIISIISFPIYVKGNFVGGSTASEEKNGLMLKLGLHLFLNNENHWITLLIISGFLHRLKNIENWFSSQRRFAFYSSSLLFFYEGSTSQWFSACRKQFRPRSSDVSALEELLKEQLTLKPMESSASSSDFDEQNAKFLKDYIDNYFSTNYRFDEETSLCSVCYLNCDICKIMQLTSSLIDVRMIDFAHVYEMHEDKNYVFGLHNLIECFQKLQQKVLQQWKIIHQV